VSLQFVTRVASRGADSWMAAGLVCFEKPGVTMLPALYDLLERCKSKCNGYVALRLDTPHRPRRTGYRSGSAHFHGHCQTISEDTGNDFEDVKMALKRRAIRRGYPAQRKKDGSIRYSLIDGQPLPQSESEASIEQENMLIEEAHQLAAELDIRLVEYEE